MAKNHGMAFGDALDLFEIVRGMIDQDVESLICPNESKAVAAEIESHLDKVQKILEKWRDFVNDSVPFWEVVKAN